MSVEWTLLALRLLAAVVLYAFLMAVIAVIWRDLRAADNRPDRSPRPDPVSQRGQADANHQSVTSPAGGRLRVVNGGEAPLPAGEAFALAEHVTLGRAADNTIALPDTYASAYHARLDRRDGEWWLTDLDSRNGTRLNDMPIRKPAPLTDGDVIGIGQTELKLEIGD